MNSIGVFQKSIKLRKLRNSFCVHGLSVVIRRKNSILAEMYARSLVSSVYLFAFYELAVWASIFNIKLKHIFQSLFNYHFHFVMQLFARFSSHRIFNFPTKIYSQFFQYQNTVEIDEKSLKTTTRTFTANRIS